MSKLLIVMVILGLVGAASVYADEVISVGTPEGSSGGGGGGGGGGAPTPEEQQQMVAIYMEDHPELKAAAQQMTSACRQDFKARLIQVLSQ